MEKTVLLALVDTRKKSAVTVQKILTEWGCLIKTRLGIHDGVLGNCSDSGLIILELVGDADKKEELCRKLSIVPGVHSQLVNLKVES